MVQGSPSPLPAPRLRQAGVERGRRFSTFYETITFNTYLFSNSINDNDFSGITIFIEF
jgi:hypothetical protein